MQRYFIDEADFLNSSVLIKKDDRHHIANVMRMKPGDELIVCHPNGNSYLAEISDIDQEAVRANLLEEMGEDPELPVNVTIAQGLPKGDKLEWIAQKGTEIGMHALIPVQMERSIVQWDHKKATKKIARLQKITKEASEQSHRTVIPEVLSVTTLEQLLQNAVFDHYLIASELEAKKDEHSSTFKQVLAKIKKNDKVLVLIGPEGGFSDKELALVETHAFTPIRLGKRILRTETAPVYVLSAMSFYFEEWS